MNYIAIVVSFLWLGLVFTACSPRDPRDKEIIAQERQEKERVAIAAFLQQQKDTFVVNEEGIWIHVEEKGDSIHPSLSSIITVAYRTEGLNGLLVDSATVEHPLRSRLARLIPGWQKTMQGIGQGGKLQMIIPADLAYGSRSIHPDLGIWSPLYFEVTLIKVEPLDL
ncbi:MAG: FKBP-type peptidyl-prolyl cis-trans isomerase [Bacteroidia bacterium]|nr:FKBP-type peptidyl-prolyl cis-trans isomerase [Bacteroidia bacterium]